MATVAWRRDTTIIAKDRGSFYLKKRPYEHDAKFGTNLQSVGFRGWLTTSGDQP